MGSRFNDDQHRLVPLFEATIAMGLRHAERLIYTTDQHVAHAPLRRLGAKNGPVLDRAEFLT